ncbi:MAG: hypothetical protein LJF15_10855 [Acidobacteria bacterium]|nr:hypothetical protein [Acidobacteriota bacterium]
MTPVNVLEIDATLADFLGGPVAIVVATRDADKRPHVVRGYAASLSEGGTRVSVHVPSRQCRHVLDAIKETGVIAAVFSRVSDYKTYQIKGIDAEIGPTVRGSTPRLAAYRDGFLDELARIGIPRESTRGLAFEEFIPLSFTSTAVFAQTPGPNAGRKLETQA